MNAAEADERLQRMALMWDYAFPKGDASEWQVRLERVEPATADAAIGRLGRMFPGRWPTGWQFEEAVAACRPTATNVHAVEPTDVPVERWRVHLAEARAVLAVAKAKSNDPRRVA